MGSIFSLLPDLDKTIVSLLVTLIALLISAIFTFLISLKMRASKSFFITCLIMPMIVAMIINKKGIHQKLTPHAYTHGISNKVLLCLELADEGHSAIVDFNGVGTGSVELLCGVANELGVQYHITRRVTHDYLRVVGVSNIDRRKMSCEGI